MLCSQLRIRLPALLGAGPHRALPRPGPALPARLLLLLLQLRLQLGRPADGDDAARRRARSRSRRRALRPRARRRLEQPPGAAAAVLEQQLQLHVLPFCELMKQLPHPEVCDALWHAVLAAALCLPRPLRPLCQLVRRPIRLPSSFLWLAVCRGRRRAYGPPHGCQLFLQQQEGRAGQAGRR